MDFLLSVLEGLVELIQTLLLSTNICVGFVISTPIDLKWYLKVIANSTAACSAVNSAPKVDV